MHVLVVDGEGAVRKVIAGWLLAEGHSCSLAADADAAMVVARNELPDAAVIDVGLARSGGAQMTECLRRATQPVRVVVLSGDGSFDQDVAVRLRADDWVVKPVARGELLRAVAPCYVRPPESRVRVDGDVTALLLRLRARHDELFAHSRRVRDLALAMARDLQIDAANMQALSDGALLHDIGRLALPGPLLTPRAPLPPAEALLVSTHPQAGYRLVSTVAGLGAAAEILLAAHEPFDSGREPGRSRATLQAGRIVAVADAYDTLATWPREPMAEPAVAASAEIAGRAGTQFDPAVVAAWFRVAEQRFKFAVPAPM
jgi:response regulator RpfG family c-di-GMP phosphodiesterase